MPSAANRVIDVTSFTARELTSSFSARMLKRTDIIIRYVISEMLVYE